MSIELITVLMFGSMFLFLALGLPVVFVLGGIGLISSIFLWGPGSTTIVVYRVASQWTTIILVACPLYIFMANMLRTAGIGEQLYTMMHLWIGGLKGGLAVGTVLMCTLFAAMSGISGAATVTMGIIALPAMLQRKYDKSLAIGCILAGGALGPLIPPSIIMIIYALYSGVSVGHLFAGGLIPGLILSALFIIYILVRCQLNPSLGPSVPPEEKVGWHEKVASLRAVVLPVFLIISILGSIFLGLATPTEAAAVGALGALGCAAIHRKLHWQTVLQASLETLKVTGMMMWIIVAATCFASVYQGLGAPDLINRFVEASGLNKWGILAFMQFSLIVFGCLMDATSMLVIVGPIFIPLAASLGFDPLWFGILYCVNTEMGYLTPPFGVNLFYMKGVVPKGITMGDIYRSISPYVTLQLIGLVIVILVPETALWFPSLLF